MPQLIDIKQAAKCTDLSVHTLYTMVNQRRVPFVRVGRLVKFDVEQLEKWIKQHTVLPMPPRAS